MKTYQFFTCILFIFSLISCSTSGELGTGINKIFQSRGYKETIKDRDSLITVNRQLQIDTARQGNLIKTLQKDIRKINGEYGFLRADFAALDSQYTSLSRQNATLKNEQSKLKTAYRIYSDSLEKKISFLTEELKSKSDEMNTKSVELDAKTAELNSKSEELNTKAGELKTMSDELTSKADEKANQAKVPSKGEERLQELKAMVARQDSITKNLYLTLRKALTGFNKDEISVEVVREKVHVSMSNTLLFKPGSVSIEDRGRKALKRLAVILNQNPDVEAMIEGHTDNKPIKSAQFKDNWDLSVVRATAIVRVLSEEYDVNPRRLTASGRGEFIPVASNEELEGRVKNRRIDMILTPKDEIPKAMGKN